MGRKVTFRSVERRHTMIGAPVELLNPRQGRREGGEGWDPTVSSEPHPHGLNYPGRLHLLRSKQLLNSATLRFKTWAFENI